MSEGNGNPRDLRLSPPLKFGLSDFARAKGEKLTNLVRQQLEPLLGDRNLVAARVVFLYEGDNQMLAGSIALQLGDGAGQFLEELMRQRYAGTLPVAHKVRRSHQQPKKS